MARPTKIGLDYFPLDTTLEDNIELLEAEHGLQGFAILIKLYQKIYLNGCCLEWSQDNALLFSRKINTDINLVNSVINTCLSRNLFDKQLYLSHFVLTSKGIQERYFKIVRDAKRKGICFPKELILVKPELIPELIELIPEESTQRKEKKRKEENRKEEYIDYKSIQEQYNTICIDLPMCKMLTDKRKKAIKTSLNNIEEDQLINVFEKAQESDFLSGRNGKWTSCNIDWLLNKNNQVKVLEGAYSNKGKTTTGNKSNDALIEWYKEGEPNE